MLLSGFGMSSELVEKLRNLVELNQKVACAAGFPVAHRLLKDIGIAKHVRADELPVRLEADEILRVTCFPDGHIVADLSADLQRELQQIRADSRRVVSHHRTSRASYRNFR